MLIERQSSSCTDNIPAGATTANSMRHHRADKLLRNLNFIHLILRSHHDASLEGILAVDTKLHIISSNRRFQELWNLPEHIMKTNDCRCYMQAIEERIDQYSSPLQLNLDPAPCLRQYCRNELRCKDGRFIMMYSSPITDMENNLLGNILFFRDITKLKITQQRLREHNETLEKKVQARNEELHKLYRDLFRKERESERQCHQLEETNHELSRLMQEISNGYNELENRVIANIKNALIPQIDRLLSTQLSDGQKKIISLLEDSLAGLTATMEKNRQLMTSSLTPRELAISKLIKDGKSSKEIANKLNCSLRTIEGHRLSIRKKLKIGKGENLRTNLLRLSMGP